jgi:hypothetical protein
LEAHIVFLSEAQNPFEEGKRPCANFRPRIHFLDERIRELAEVEPDSPLVSVFFPLLERDESKLVAGFRQRYAKLRESAEIPVEARERWKKVFQLWLMRALGAETLKEIEKMLLEDLPEVEETAWGKELIAIHQNLGREEGREEGQIAYIEGKLRDLEQRKSAGEISADAFEYLSAELRTDLAQLRSED